MVIPKALGSNCPACLVGLTSPLQRQAMSLHIKCRFPNEYVYKRPEDGQTQRIKRTDVPAGYISWDIHFETYDPLSFTAPHILKAPWADPELSQPDFQPKWNQIDGNINRKSHEGPYKIQNGLPLNIRGRTGLSGRGILGRFGPNHAADPIVTRWKRENGEIVKCERNGRPILQFVAIQRRDTNEWAIPGGKKFLKGLSFQQILDCFRFGFFEFSSIFAS